MRVKENVSDKSLLRFRSFIAKTGYEYVGERDFCERSDEESESNLLLWSLEPIIFLTSTTNQISSWSLQGNNQVRNIVFYKRESRLTTYTCLPNLKNKYPLHIHAI